MGNNLNLGYNSPTASEVPAEDGRVAGGSESHSSLHSERVPKIVVNVLQPYTLLIFPIIVACFLVFQTIAEIIKWTILILSLLIVPPLGYQYLRRWYLEKQGKETSDFHTLYRNSKKDMVSLAILFILPTLLASHSLHYPKTIFAPIIALFSITIFNLILNLFYKSSFHLAGLSGCLTSLWFLIGKYSFFFLPLVPLLSISKKRIGHHTNSQMLVGFLIGIFVTALVFKKMGF